MKRLIVIIGVLALSIIFGGVSYAATVTANLEVSATYVGVCMVSTTAVNFGNVTGQGTMSAQGNVAVNCSTGVNYHIALDAGLHYSGTKRHVSGGGMDVIYSLFKLVGLELWGDSDYANTFPLGTSLADTSIGGNQDHTVSAELDNFFGGTPGTVLTDTVTVTVHY
jgi:spore coat protein U-like protein